MLLRDKTALITGAGRGIGRAIALAFAEQGCNIVAAARTQDEIDETARLVEAAGSQALVVQLDVTSSESIAAAVKATVDAFGSVDILVNNAGRAHFVEFENLTLEQWQKTLDVNLTGPFLCCQAVLPAMKSQRHGRIINIASVNSLKPIEKQAAYCASKFGLNGFTKSLALELRQHNIAVHAICPGAVVTRLAEDAMPERDKTDWMTPEDVAHAALYLATMNPRATTDELVVRRFGSTPL